MTERLGIGPHAMWGFSPALDLLEAYLKHHPHRDAGESVGDQPINVLLVNPNDIRHVLRTISTRNRHFAGETGKRARPVHFYIWDRPNEVLARHLALLQVARDYSLPIRQRANLWLEIFGNTLVQERTAAYIDKLGRDLVKLVCDGEGVLAGVADLSLLKFRERDALEMAFKTWGVKVPYDVANLRDARLRHYYGQRYDSRTNVADWDYHEGIKPVASIIHYKQFRDWRRSGVAFEFGDQTYTNPNRTMASYAEGQICKGKDRGFKKEVRGYWLDIVVGPYAAVGVDCDKPNKLAQDLFLIHNKGTGTEQHRHHAVEVAVYNLLSYLYEIEHRQVYTMTREHDIFSGLGVEDGEGEGATSAEPAPVPTAEPETDKGKEEEGERVVELSPEEFDRQMKLQREKEGREARGEAAAPPATGEKKTEEAPQQEGEPAKHKLSPEQEENVQQAFDGVKVFMLGDDFRSMYTKKRFQGLFDVASFSVGSSHFLADKEVVNLFSPAGAHVHVENVKYMPTINKASKIEYVNKIESLAAELGLTDDFGKKKRNIEDLKLRDDLPYMWAARPEA